jgi:hypothetical protein
MHDNLTALLKDQLLNQRQPDSRSLIGAAVLAFNAVKPLENARQLSLRNSNTGIADGQRDVRRIAAHRHFDPPLQSELERIGEEIEDDLLPHLSIDIDRLGDRRAVDVER